MRLLAIILFTFTTSVFSLEPDLSDLVAPKQEQSYIWTGCNGTSHADSGAAIQSCVNYLTERKQSHHFVGCSVSRTVDHTPTMTTAYIDCVDGFGSDEYIETVSASSNGLKNTCPPENPDEILYTLLVTADDGSEWCAKPLSEVGDNCPAPRDDDYTQLGNGQQETFCYTNPDGTQCKITTNENGDFTLPNQYGTQEPSICHDAPVDTPDPDPMPDVPEVPDAEDPTPDDNSTGDDSDKSTEIDAQNQINDNLTIINDSINTASDENSERLNLIKDNIDNSNLYLDAIEENTGKSLGALQQQTALLAEIRDKEDKDKAITVNANRKTGGLNDFFTEEDKAQLAIELENKKQQLTDVYTQIQNDVTDRFNFSNSISGTYESRTITWNGHQKEIGAARLSENFFKQLAPIVLLVCSIIALGILLWE